MKSKLIPILLALLLLLAGCGAEAQKIPSENFTYARDVSEAEKVRRDSFVAAATAKLGINEGDGSHKTIIDAYNAHKPLAQGYAVSYDDEWCATFVSTVSIECGMTDIIPTECSCERQIELWKSIGRWEENDNYLPLPGDYIYYDWDQLPKPGNCTGWSDHVGIVVGTAGPFIKVIEGNKDDTVAYRIIPKGYYQIRGFGLPDYTSKLP